MTEDTVTLLIQKVDSMSKELATHNEDHAKDMKRVLPIIEAYETAQANGRFVKWIAQILIACGVIWAGVKFLFPQI